MVGDAGDGVGWGWRWLKFFGDWVEMFFFFGGGDEELRVEGSCGVLIMKLMAGRLDDGNGCRMHVIPTYAVCMGFKNVQAISSLACPWLIIIFLSHHQKAWWQICCFTPTNHRYWIQIGGFSKNKKLVISTNHPFWQSSRT